MNMYKSRYNFLQVVAVIVVESESEELIREALLKIKGEAHSNFFELTFNFGPL